MKILKKKEYEYTIYFGLLIFIGIIFFFYLGEQGYIIEKDSGVFLEKRVPGQYFVYPKFLVLCQIIFGEENYLEWVSVIQGMFALGVSLITTEYLRLVYKMNYWYGVIIFLCTFGPYAYSLPQYVSSHSIMTEGLSFPLFYLWMICVLQIYLKNKNVWFISLFFLTTVMAYTRPQLTLLFFVCLVMVIERIIFYFTSKINEKWRKRFAKISVFICFMGLVLGIKVFLMFIENNLYPQMTDAVAGRIFCTVEATDAELFEGKNRDLFLGIYNEIEQMETRKCYFRKGIRKWEDIVNATNENTKKLSNIIRQYYMEVDMKEINNIKGEMAYKLMIEHWDDYITMSAELLLQSLVVSIFFHPESAYTLGYVVAMILYGGGIASIVVSKKKYGIKKEYLVPLKITMLVIGSICVITNVLFIGIQRYVVYPLGFFYISLIILYSEIREYRKIRHGDMYTEYLHHEFRLKLK